MTIYKSASISLSAGLAIALLAGASGVAAAKDVKVIAPPSDALTELVSYGDLDLASATGTKRLTFRVRGAVRRVCEPLSDRRMLADHASCTSYAWNGAKPQMDRAMARAHEVASNGTSSIAPVAIVISAPAR